MNSTPSNGNICKAPVVKLIFNFKVNIFFPLSHCILHKLFEGIIGCSLTVVLKNGKNIFPEEMENLVNKIEGVKESFIFGKQQSEDKENIKINVKIVYDKDIMKNVYNAKTEAEIKKALLDKVKEINAQIPKYKAIRGIYITEEPLIKTTTNKIKRQDNLNAIK